MKDGSLVGQPTRGFSLMELVMVMSIITIFSAIAAPRYIGAIQNYRINATAKRIQVDLEYARARAKSISTSRTVAFDTINDQYSLNDESALDRTGQPYLVQVNEEPYVSSIRSLDLGGDGQIVFDGFGMPDAEGAIIVGNGSRRLAIIIDGITGEISIEEATTELQAVLGGKGVVVDID